MILSDALRASRFKIVVFLAWVLGLVTVLGALMYLIEGPEHGFTSVPRAIYWAIVTLTTVGYGVVVPQTPLGQLLAAFVMILGYCIIAVPTGIVSAELARAPGVVTTESCPECSLEGHEVDAVHCKYCGAAL
jgi:voltage-gated potassium channel